VKSASQPLTVEEQTEFKALLLPVDVILHPSQELAEWLDGFSGQKLVLPRPVPGWTWSGMSGRSGQDLYRLTALILRQMAEGQEVRNQSPASGWMTAFYILLGLIVAPILISILGSVIFQ